MFVVMAKRNGKVFLTDAFDTLDEAMSAAPAMLRVENAHEALVKPADEETYEFTLLARFFWNRDGDVMGTTQAHAHAIWNLAEGLHSAFPTLPTRCGPDVMDLALYA